MFDGEAFGAQIVEAVRTYVAEALAPIQAELEALRKRPDDAEVERRIAHAVREAVAALPKPVDGKDGRDGVDGERGAQGEAGPTGERGEPGERGEAGLAGRDAPAPTDEQVEAAVRKALEPVEGMLNPIAVEVQRWMEAFPPAAGPQGEPGPRGEAGQPGERGLDGKDGRDGLDGKDGAPGQAGERGERGLDGKDGVGLAGALIDRAGELVVTLTNGETRSLGPVVGRDGRDGLDGKDGARGESGFGLDDFDSEVLDGGRRLLVRFQRGDVLETQEHLLEIAIYRGVFRADHGAYERGDMVTFGGSLWHCNVPTADPPKEGVADWTLAAKRGQNGRDGAPGKDGERGPQGLPGKDAGSWA